jgi:hypothetical protein
MATVQTDGSSAVTSSSTKNNHGTAMNVGSSATVLETRALGFRNVGVFASKPYDGGSADEALSAGTFAYNNQRPIAQRSTTTISGVSNTNLRSGANDQSSLRSIHRQEKVRSTRTTSAIRAGYWNIYSGTWSTTPTTAVDNFWDNAAATTSATSTDQAASPTRSVPGELVYKTGKLAPVLDNYKAKTG